MTRWTAASAARSVSPVDESELTRLLGDKQHCLQEKHDGRGLLVRKQGSEITCINRREGVVANPEPIRHAVEELPVDVLIDGEAIGDTPHAFDVLELKCYDISSRPYLHRAAGLLRTASIPMSPVRSGHRPVIPLDSPLSGI